PMRSIVNPMRSIVLLYESGIGSASAWEADHAHRRTRRTFHPAGHGAPHRRRRGPRPRFPPPGAPSGPMSRLDELAELGEPRLRLMDEAGITTQVLSAAGPGADLLPPAEGPAF